MARSKSRSGTGRRAARTPEPAAAPAEVEVVEEESGLGFEAGVAIITTVVLFVALLFLDYGRGSNYGEGLLFKGKYDAAATAPADDGGE